MHGKMCVCIYIYVYTFTFYYSLVLVYNGSETKVSDNNFQSAIVITRAYILAFVFVDFVAKGILKM